MHSDPREGLGEEIGLEEEQREDIDKSESVVSKFNDGNRGSSKDEENWMEFLCLGVWAFSEFS